MKRQFSDQSPRVDKDSLSPATRADKAPIPYNESLHLPGAAIQTDLDFIITGWSEPAEGMYDLSDAMGKNVFDIASIDFPGGSSEAMKEYLREHKTWKGNVRPKQTTDTTAHFPFSMYYILNKQGEPASIIIIADTANRQTDTEQRLAEAEAIYKTLINTLEEGILMIGATGLITTSNKRASEILSLTEEQLLGKIPVSSGWKVFRPDGRIFPDSELPAVVSLQTGFPQKNIPMRIEKKDGTSIWIAVSSYALVREGEFSPYAVVVSFSDITKEKNLPGN